MSLLLIGVSGGSGSGKTMVSKLIAKDIDDICILSSDNFYKTIDPNLDINLVNFDDPAAIDIDLFYDCILSLKMGKETRIPIYDFILHKRKEEQLVIKPHKILIVEGIFIFSIDKIFELFDLRIFVDTSPELRLSRRITRDLVERSRTIESIIDQYNTYVVPSYTKFILPTRRKCDLIIPNDVHIGENEFIGVSLINSVIKNKLKSYDIILK